MMCLGPEAIPSSCTWLIKDMKSWLSPFVALLFNKSLASGCFPQDFKNAVVIPRLKNNSLDTSQMKNYRPVSNLSFISKLLERFVQLRLQEFLDSNNLMPGTQSGYRQYGDCSDQGVQRSSPSWTEKSLLCVYLTLQPRSTP